MTDREWACFFGGIIAWHFLVRFAVWWNRLPKPSDEESEDE
jgi:hypothetical protein